MKTLKYYAEYLFYFVFSTVIFLILDGIFCLEQTKLPVLMIVALIVMMERKINKLEQPK